MSEKRFLSYNFNFISAKFKAKGEQKIQDVYRSAQKMARYLPFFKSIRKTDFDVNRFSAPNLNQC